MLFLAYRAGILVLGFYAFKHFRQGRKKLAVGSISVYLFADLFLTTLGSAGALYLTSCGACLALLLIYVDIYQSNRKIVEPPLSQDSSETLPPK